MKQIIYTKFATTLVYSLLGVMLCSSCSSVPPKATRAQYDVSSPFKTPAQHHIKKPGIWHTGRPNRAIRHQEYANLHTKLLGQRNYTMYGVTHDGSCGFYSFIPIMLDYLLVENRYKDWLASAKDMLFQKAQPIINGDTRVKNKYNQLAPSEDLGLVYAKTASLLDALNREPEARKLQREEIETLTHFLRHLILSREVILEANKGDKRKLAPEIMYLFIDIQRILQGIADNEEIKGPLQIYYQKYMDALGSTENKILQASSPQKAQNLLNIFLQKIAEEIAKRDSLLSNTKIKESLLNAQKHVKNNKNILSEKEPLNTFERTKRWWASPCQLADLGIPLIILFDYHTHPDDKISSIAIDTSGGSAHKWPHKKSPASPKIIIHHHDKAYFDYLVQGEESKTKPNQGHFTRVH